MRQKKIQKKEKLKKIMKEKMSQKNYQKEVNQKIQIAKQIKQKKEQRDIIDIKSFGRFNIQDVVQQLKQQPNKKYILQSKRNSIPKFINLIEILKQEKFLNIKIYLDEPSQVNIQNNLNNSLMDFVESDLKFLLIFRNKDIDIDNEQANPLDSYRTIFLYKKTWPEETQKQWESEMSLILLKYRDMKLRIKERSAIYSQFQDYSWYITKDEFGNYYLFLAHASFQEKYIYKLQYKAKIQLEIFAEQIEEDIIDQPVDKDKFQGVFRNKDTYRKVINDRIEMLIDSYNNAIFKKLGLSSLQNIKVSATSSDISLDIKHSAVLVKSEDPQEFYQRVEQRQTRLLIVQVVVMICILLSIIFGIINHLQQITE